MAIISINLPVIFRADGKYLKPRPAKPKECALQTLPDKFMSNPTGEQCTHGLRQLLQLAH